MLVGRFSNNSFERADHEDVALKLNPNQSNLLSSVLWYELFGKSFFICLIKESKGWLNFLGGEDSRNMDGSLIHARSCTLLDVFNLRQFFIAISLKTLYYCLS